MKNKTAERISYLVLVIVMAAIGVWLRQAIPHVRMVLHDPEGRDRDLLPYWAPIPMITGAFIFHIAWILEKYFDFRIRRALKKHQQSRLLMESIKKAPRKFEPQERIDAIDNYFVTQLRLRKAATKAWLSRVSPTFAFIGAVTMTFTLWPVLWMIFGALFGFER